MHFESAPHLYEDRALSRAQVFRWFQTFSEERQSIQDELLSRRPSSSRIGENVNRIWDIVRSARQVTVRTIGKKSHSADTTAPQILNELRIRKILCKRWFQEILRTAKGTSVQKGALTFWNQFLTGIIDELRKSSNRALKQFNLSKAINRNSKQVQDDRNAKLLILIFMKSFTKILRPNS